MEAFRYVGIDHVQVAIPAGSEDIGRSFYVEKLGMRELPKPENLRKNGGFWVEVGRHQLHLGIMREFSPASKAHPAFEVDRLHDFRRSLEGKGVTVIEGDELEGASRFYVVDPFGNRLEFLEWERI